MSRGLGKLQREILAYLERSNTGSCAVELAYLLANDWADNIAADQSKWFTRAQLVSVRRAIHGLHARGFVEVDAARTIGPDIVRALGVRLPSQEWPSYFNSTQRQAEVTAKWRAYMR